MEEKIKDVYENIKDRITNPLLFSFVCSWLVYNWKIPVALLWYDKSQFSGCGCTTIFDFIEWYWINEGTFRIPFIIAIVYTLVSPFVKNGISVINAVALSWGKRSKAKYVKELYIKEINQLTTSLNAITAEKNTLDVIISKISDMNLLNGQWKFYKKNVFDEQFDQNKFDEEDILINNGVINKYDAINKVIGNKEFIIRNFFFNKNNNEIIFIKNKIGSSENQFYLNNFVNVLSITNGDFNNLTGFEDGIEVKYKKIN